MNRKVYTSFSFYILNVLRIKYLPIFLRAWIFTKPQIPQVRQSLKIAGLVQIFDVVSSYKQISKFVAILEVGECVNVIYTGNKNMNVSLSRKRLLSNCESLFFVFSPLIKRGNIIITIFGQ